MIAGTSGRLRAPGPKDVDVLVALRNDVDLQLTLLARPRPNSAERVEGWVSRLGADAAACLFVITELGSDEAAGFVQLTGIDTVSGHAHLGIAVQAEHRGHGLGREAVMLAWEYARAVWGLRKLLLEVRADNTGAIALYRRLGFRDVGTFEAHFRVGDVYHDVLAMELVGAVDS